ncbi:hypothetical protein [Pseudovibrio sp. Ad37]|uniref:hypothetical protein n=1 Tax=Pseudovibrio sp. Ad37 TaxID=989422 RepID=UPI0007AEB191|nr:hypothetical protein [Pseudovibrio sp. Ad37]KZL18169.1 hypothetical protein PsAD37_03924 [Pseudovibrio sp. Ad37]
MTEEIDASYLGISDPSLEYTNNLGIAWYAGAQDLKLQSTLPKIIQKFIKASNSKRNVFAGSSAGGFAALFYASMLPQSTFLAVNPQTDIFKYKLRAVERYASACFGWHTPSSLEGSFRGICTNLMEKFRQSNIPGGLYLQNANDTHVPEHAVPLISFLGGTQAIDQNLYGINFIFREWGKGHAPLPLPIYQQTLKGLTERDIETAKARFDEGLLERFSSDILQFVSSK